MVVLLGQKPLSHFCVFYATASELIQTAVSDLFIVPNIETCELLHSWLRLRECPWRSPSLSPTECDWGSWGRSFIHKPRELGQRGYLLDRLFQPQTTGAIAQIFNVTIAVHGEIPATLSTQSRP